MANFVSSIQDVTDYYYCWWHLIWIDRDQSRVQLLQIRTTHMANKLLILSKVIQMYHFSCEDIWWFYFYLLCIGLHLQKGPLKRLHCGNVWLQKGMHARHVTRLAIFKRYYMISSSKNVLVLCLQFFWWINDLQGQESGLTHLQGI